MKKLMSFALALTLLTSVSMLAQDTMNQGGSKSDTSMSKSDTSMKSAKVTGKISDDGKSFVSDKDGKSWTISNPDAVKGHEGHHVTLKAKVSADKNEVEVMSLKMASDNMKNDSMK